MIKKSFDPNYNNALVLIHDEIQLEFFDNGNISVNFGKTVDEEFESRFTITLNDLKSLVEDADFWLKYRKINKTFGITE